MSLPSRALGRLLLLTAATATTTALVAHAPSATAAPSPRSDRDTAQVAVVAHRGSSGVAPENTLAATRAALRQRSDVVEIDVHRTRDGELVLLHDTSLARTTDAEQVFPDRAPWHVGDFSLRELRRLDAGSWFDAGFAGEGIPTLGEWARATGGRADLLIEVKSPQLYPGIDRDLDAQLRGVPALRRAVARDRVVVQSFDHAWLRGYAQIAPEVPVGLLFGSSPTAAQVADAATWAEQVNPALGAITEPVVAQIQAAGLEAHVWTVNEGIDMRRAVRWGVDGIITNYPQVLREVLRGADGGRARGAA